MDVKVCLKYFKYLLILILFVFDLFLNSILISSSPEILAQYPPVPTPPPGGTPLPPTTRCYYPCSDAIDCSNGTYYKLRCCGSCSGGLDCCSVDDRTCEPVPQPCPDMGGECTVAADCEGSFDVWSIPCGFGSTSPCFCNNICGSWSISSWNAWCNNGYCDYNCNWCEDDPSSTPPPPCDSPEIDCTCFNDGTVWVAWTDVAGADSYPIRVDDNPVSWPGFCPYEQIPLGDFCNNSIPNTTNFWMNQGQAGHTYHIWLHNYDAACADPWNNPAAECWVTCPTPPNAVVQGRVRSAEDSGTWYWRRGDGNDCLTAPCPGGNCHENDAVNLRVECINGIYKDANWSCNAGGAYYSTGTIYNSGEDVQCCVNEGTLPTNYECVDSDNNLNCCRREDRNTLVIGANDWQFDIQCLAPTAPTNLTITRRTGANCNSIRLNWVANSNDEDGFRIYRDGVQIGSVGAGVEVYNLTCPDNGSHNYYVQAYKTCADFYKTGDSNTESFTCNNIPPQAPVLTAPLSSIDETFTSLEWNNLGPPPPTDYWGCNIDAPDGSENHYIVYLRPNDNIWDNVNDKVDGSCGNPPNCPDCSYRAWDPSSIPGSGLTCGIITNLNWGTNYYWKVRACNSDLETNEFCSENESSYTAYPGNWWQSMGGNIYAKDDINSNIPNTSTNLMLNSSKGTHGIAFFGGTLDEGYSALAESDPQWEVDLVDLVELESNLYAGREYNYQFWLYHLLNEDKQAISPGNVDVASLGSDDETVVYINDLPAADLNLTSGTAPSNRNVIVLYNGDVNILGSVTVEVGGFFMVVSSGQINIDTALGLPSGSYVDIKGLEGNQAQLQGIYIANQITTGTSNLQLWVGGSLIGWNNITLLREIDSIESITKPSMVFIFRPDFIVNAPDIIKKVNFPKWQQVPG